MKDIENRVAIVTGGASGIGRSVALKLSERGAKISIGDLQELPREEGEETRGIIEDRGGEVIFTKTDISETDQVKKLIERTANYLNIKISP